MKGAGVILRELEMGTSFRTTVLHRYIQEIRSATAREETGLGGKENTPNETHGRI